MQEKPYFKKGCEATIFISKHHRDVFHKIKKKCIYFMMFWLLSLIFSCIIKYTCDEGDVSGKLNKLPQKCHMKNCPMQKKKIEKFN